MIPNTTLKMAPKSGPKRTQSFWSAKNGHFVAWWHFAATCRKFWLYNWATGQLWGETLGFWVPSFCGILLVVCRLNCPPSAAASALLLIA